MSTVGIRELVEARQGESLELWAKTINPQFARVLKTIGFDRTWARAEGAYLWDADGNRFLDLLGGFGMFNVGRNNPRVRAALVEALELDLPGCVQLGASPLPPLLAEELLRRTPARLERVLFTSTGTEAVEAALKLGRAATGRARVVSADARLPRADARLALGQREPRVHEPLRPAAARVRAGAVRRPRRARGASCAARTSPSSSSSRCRGRACNLPPAGYLAGAPGALPPLRDALLRRRGADGLRPHGKAVRVRALGARARPGHRGEVALGRLRAGRRADDVESGARGRVRLDGECVQPRLHVRPRTSSRWPPASRRCTSSTSRASSSARRALGERLLELTRAARRAPRRRARRARARPDVGDRVRASRRRAPLLPAARALPAGPLRPARRRAALPRPPHPEPGRRPRPGR